MKLEEGTHGVEVGSASRLSLGFRGRLAYERHVCTWCKGTSSQGPCPAPRVCRGAKYRARQVGRGPRYTAQGAGGGGTIMREGSLWVWEWDAGAEDMQLCFKNRRESHRAARRGVSRREPRAQQHQGFFFLPCRTTSSMSAMPAPAHLDDLAPRTTLAASSRRTKMGETHLGLLSRGLGGLGSLAAEKGNIVVREPGHPEGGEVADATSPIHHLTYASSSGRLVRLISHPKQPPTRLNGTEKNATRIRRDKEIRRADRTDAGARQRRGAPTKL